MEIIGVTLDVDCDRARAVLARKPTPWAQVCSGEGQSGAIATSYNLLGTPTYVVIDGTGALVGRQGSFEGLETLVRETLAGRGTPETASGGRAPLSGSWPPVNDG